MHRRAPVSSDRRFPAFRVFSEELLDPEKEFLSGSAVSTKVSIAHFPDKNNPKSTTFFSFQGALSMFSLSTDRIFQDGLSKIKQPL
jgi:hypothetical protein